MNIHYHLRFATLLSHLLDEQFRIGKFRFGLDPLLGFLPVFGDVIALIFSLYIVLIGFMLKLSQEKIASMLRNVLFDFLIGLFPVIGDITDFVYKANIKNLRIIHEHVGNVVEGDVA